MWTYKQSSGELSHDGVVVGYGWSGWDDGINIPAMQHLANVGPIPRGKWWITGMLVTTEKHGPYVLRLEPAPDTQTYERAGFLIHGASAIHPFETSRGCIILNPNLRAQIWQSGDHELEVVG